ncbi:unnamed protein product, partial [Didymodactylos carnosus]
DEQTPKQFGQKKQNQSGYSAIKSERSPSYLVHKRIGFKNPVVLPCEKLKSTKTLLITILSRSSNSYVREAIRKTWGALRTYNHIDIRLVFFVAVDDTMLRQIEIEQLLYHDVVQITLPENYAVVSYKELASLCWSQRYCSSVEYIFKADEDIHLNTPLLAKTVEKFYENVSLPNIPLIFGWFRYKSRVDRVGRYVVTEEEYDEFYYPPYTFGIGYLLTKAGRNGLCAAANTPHPVTRVGDAYITGILRGHAQVGFAFFADLHFIYSYSLSGDKCKDYFIHDEKLLICMASLHSGIHNASHEYVHTWNSIYSDPE